MFGRDFSEEMKGSAEKVRPDVAHQPDLKLQGDHSCTPIALLSDLHNNGDC